jgi:two-component system alkaline phosphatase synthesis response regulator PhoP
VNRPGTAKTARVLVVEDEHHLAAGIAENLELEGYRVDVAHDGKSGLERIVRREHDLVVLDVMLPGMDGFAVCRRAREQGCNTPILFLTAKGELGDRLRGLDAGGDDYLAKPFHLEELLLRVKAILRRWEWYTDVPQTESVVRFGQNEFDIHSLQGRSWDGTAHALTQKEAMILKVLSERPAEVVSREEMLEAVWGYEAFPSTRTIDNFILRLRKRFERDPSSPRFFHTVRGVGYRFTPQGEDPPK